MALLFCIGSQFSCLFRFFFFFSGVMAVRTLSLFFSLSSFLSFACFNGSSVVSCLLFL